MSRAIVIGSSGGLGRALTGHLVGRGDQVQGLARSGTDPAIDITNEASVKAAAERLRPAAPYDLVIVATGLLHDSDLAPEKALSELSSAGLLRYFEVNSVGPSLVAKHFTPLLPKVGRSVFAVLSARVGSISDNKLGGWYGYRASKAALNMMVKTLSVELKRTRPEAICVALHPGTVDTPLSKPFQRSVPEDRLFTAAYAAKGLIGTLAGLSGEDSGGCFAWDGSRIPA